MKFWLKRLRVLISVKSFLVAAGKYWLHSIASFVVHRCFWYMQVPYLNLKKQCTHLWDNCKDGTLLCYILLPPPPKKNNKQTNKQTKKHTHQNNNNNNKKQTKNKKTTNKQTKKTNPKHKTNKKTTHTHTHTQKQQPQNLALPDTPYHLPQGRYLIHICIHQTRAKPRSAMWCLIVKLLLIEDNKLW